MEKIQYPRRFWPALVIFGLVGQVAWVVENMYFNVFIYKMFQADAGAISLMVAASAISATVTTLLIGAFSDKIGRRKIFICGGYILWGISICSFALIRMDILQGIVPATVSAASVGIALVIIMDCVMTFFGSSANDACFNAWLTDVVPEQGRGKAEGINAMMPLLAIIVVFGGFMFFDLGKASSWTMIYMIIGLVVLLIGILGFFLIQEQPVRNPENQHYFKNIVYGFRPAIMKQNPILYLILLAFAIFGISIQIFMPYLILYYNVSLGMDNYVLVMAPAIVLASVVTAFYGRVYDAAGFQKALIPALSTLAAGYVLLYCFRSVVFVFIGSLLMMCGYLMGMAVFGAAIRDYIPKGKAGMFQGLRIVGQVLIPGIVGPAIGSWILSNAQTILNDDGTTSFIPDARIFLAALIVILVLIPVLIPLCRRMRKEKL